MPYSVGTVFLEVVPSFHNVQRSSQRAAKDMGKSFETEAGKSFDVVEKKAKTSAKKTSGAFANEMGKQLEKALSDLKVQFDVGPDGKKLDRELAKIFKKVEAFSKIDFRLHPELDADDALRKLRKFEAELQALKNNKDLDIDLRVNAGAAQQALETVRTRARIALGATKEQIALERQQERERTQAARARASAEAAAARVQAQQAAAQRRQEAADRAAKRTAEQIAAREARKTAKDTSDAQIANYRRETTELRKELNLRAQAARAAQQSARLATTRAGRSGSDSDVDTGISELAKAREAELAKGDAAYALREHLERGLTRTTLTQVELRKVAQDRADDHAVRSAVASNAEIMAVENLRARATRRNEDLARRNQNQTLSQAWAANIGQAANSFRLFNGGLLTAITLGPLLIPILAGIGAGLGGIALLATGALAGVGVLVAGFGGIGTALQAIGAVRKEKTARTTGSKSDASLGALKGLRDAQLALTRAREDSGQRIAAAASRQAQAEKALTGAVKSATDAQIALVDARASAARQLEDMNSQLAGGKLDEQLAAFSLQEAGFRLNNVLEDPQASDREKSIAQLEYEQAKLQFSDLQRANARLEQDTAEANAKGVEGADEVVQAKQNIIDANQGIADAQAEVADAGVQLTRAQVDESRTLADAQQRVADAMLEVQNASVDAGVAGSSAMDQLREAMLGLSPAAQTFAYFLDGLRPLLDQIRAAAQTGLLPGVQTMLSDLIATYGPSLINFVGTVAKVLGDLFVAAGQALTAPFWQNFFGLLADLAPGLLTDLATIIGSLVTVFAGLLTAFAPYADDIIGFFVGIAGGLAEWAKNLGGSEGFSAFMAYVAKTGPKVAQLLGDVMIIILKLAIGLAPYADKLLDFLLGMVDWLAGLDPSTLAALALGIIAIVAALQILAGFIAIVSSVFGLIAGIAAAIGAVIAAGGLTAIAAAIAPFLAIAAAVVAVIALLALLVIGVIHLWKTNETFRDIVTGVWGYIAESATFVFGIILGIFNALVSFLEMFVFPVFITLWEGVISPVLNFIIGLFQIAWAVISTVFNAIVQIIQFIVAPAFAWLYENVIKPFWEDNVQPIFDALGSYIENNVAPAFQRGLDVIASIWNQLIEIAKAPVRFVVDTVINQGIIGTFNKLVDLFPGMTKIDPIQLPAVFSAAGAGSGGGGHALAFAGGGVLPGYTPGRDVHRFVSPTGGVLDLSGGEGIARPEIVAMLGKRRWNAMNAAARGGDMRAAMGYLGGYSEGGILGWIGRAADSATDAIGGATSDIAHLLSNPGEILHNLVAGLVGTGNTGIAGLAGGMAVRLADGIGNTLGSLLGSNGGPDAGGRVSEGGIGWQRMEQLVLSAFPGIAFTSAFRPGAITAVGTKSYHSVGRAIDIAPSLAVFNWLAKNFPDSRELFYTPAGTQNWINQGHKGFNAAPVTVAQHKSHVHWAYADGGIYGDGVPRGLASIANRPQRMTPLTDSQIAALVGGGRGAGPSTTFEVGHMGADARDVARELDTIRRDRIAAYGIDTIGVGIS